MSATIQENILALRSSVNESGRSFRTYFISFVAIAFYILAIASSTGHELLFRSGNVTMPVIHLSVPVIWYFVVAPCLLFLLHINLVIQATFLSEKIMHYDTVLSDPTFKSEHVENEHSLLVSVPIAHVLARVFHNRDTQLVLLAFVLLSCVALPLVCLAYILIQFLPYQSEPITWLHRSCLFLDCLVLLLAWNRIVSPRLTRSQWWRTRPLFHYFVIVFFAALFGLFTLTANVKGGFIDKVMWPSGLDRIFPRHLDVSGRTLVLREPSPEILSSLYQECRASNRSTNVECDEVIAPGSREWCKQATGLTLNGRQLGGIDLRNSVLCGANFLGANVTDANLEGAILYGADFTDAHLTRTRLVSATLQDGTFSGANLVEARLNNANLRCALLSRSPSGQGYADRRIVGETSSGASMDTLGATKLQNADLSQAQLQCANLEYAELYGADMEEAILHGTNLSHANMEGANLQKTEIYASDLSDSNLLGVDMDQASIFGSNLRSANLTDARWSRIDIRGSVLLGANFTGVTIRVPWEARLNREESKVLLSDLDDTVCGELRKVENEMEKQEYYKVGEETQLDEELKYTEIRFNEWVKKNGEENYFGHLDSSCWLGYSPPSSNSWHSTEAPKGGAFGTARRDFLIEQLACWDQWGYAAKAVIEETIIFDGVEEMLKKKAEGNGGACEGMRRGWQRYRGSVDRIDRQ